MTVRKDRWRRVFEFLNKPLMIWALSTVTVTVVGWYYTSFQQCVRDADEYERTYSKLTTEIDDRRAYIRRAVVDAETSADLRAAMQNLPYVYREYKEATLKELRGDLALLRRHVRFGYSDNLKDTIWAWGLAGAGPELELFRDGRLRGGITEEEFALLKKRAANDKTQPDSIRSVGTAPYYMTINAFKAFGVPSRDCSVPNLFRRATGDLYVPVLSITPWNTSAQKKFVIDEPEVQ